MLTGIFDTHAHYDDAQFDFIRHATLGGMPRLGVSRILNCGSDEESSLFSAELAEQYPFLYGAAGIHPHAAAKAGDGWQERIAELLGKEKMLAVGEIGLDYYYHFSDRVSQRRIFAESLALAKEFSLPVIVHDREAHADTLAMLREYRPNGVVHRFSGTPEMAEELTALGLYLGFGCAVTYKNAVNERNTLRMLPLNRLLLETDCPYLPPEELRGELCTSDMISFAAKTAASLRGDCTAQQLADIARENGERLFLPGLSETISKNATGSCGNENRNV